MLSHSEGVTGKPDLALRRRKSRLGLDYPFAVRAELTIILPKQSARKHNCPRLTNRQNQLRPLWFEAYFRWPTDIHQLVQGTTYLPWLS
jgi:hypothetical protein